MTTRINIQNKTAVLALLKTAGVKWAAGVNLEPMEPATQHVELPLHVTGKSLRHRQAKEPFDIQVNTLDELASILFPEKKTSESIKLIHGNEARLDYKNKTVTIGCKTIPFSAVAQFQAAVAPRISPVLMLDDDEVEINFDNNEVECDEFFVTFAEINKIAELVERAS